MTDLHYYAVLSREGKYMLARIAGLPGCNTFAKINQSIEKQTMDALVGHLEARLLLKRKIGRPKKPNPNIARIMLRLQVPPKLAARVQKTWKAAAR